MSPLLVFLLGSILFFSCEMNNNNHPASKKYCGFEMSKNEVFEVQVKSKEYNYSDTDWEIHGEIAAFAQEIGGDTVIIEVFFFLSNESELGIILSGPKDAQIVERMNCAIINGKYKNKTPLKKYILYYDENDETNLLAGIKSKM